MATATTTTAAAATATTAKTTTTTASEKSGPSHISHALLNLQAATTAANVTL